MRLMRLISLLMRQLFWWDPTLLCIAFPPGSISRLFIDLWVVFFRIVTHFWDGWIDALWFLIRITRIGFFLPEKKIKNQSQTLSKAKQNELRDPLLSDICNISTWASPTYLPAYFFQTKDQRLQPHRWGELHQQSSIYFRDISPYLNSITMI